MIITKIVNTVAKNSPQNNSKTESQTENSIEIQENNTFPEKTQQFIDDLRLL